MRCYNCGSPIKEKVELILVKGKSIPQKVKKCGECGKSTVSLDEYERIRKEIHPHLLTKIKGFFKTNLKSVDVHKGKVL